MISRAGWGLLVVGVAAVVPVHVVAVAVVAVVVVVVVVMPAVYGAGVARAWTRLLWQPVADWSLLGSWDRWCDRPTPRSSSGATRCRVWRRCTRRSCGIATRRTS